ncbi:MAG: UbiA family prenyltransferase [Candidatus Micrarchaeia archaeon]
MIKEYWKLTRFEHSIMLAVAVLIGEVITRPLHSKEIILTLLPPMLVGAASFAVNDYFDLKSDRINRRADRPLVAGKIKPVNALLLSIILFILGTALSAFINFNCFLLVASFSILSFLYSFKLKDVALLGNTYIALTMAVPFIYGGLAVANEIPHSILLLSSIAFVSGLGREIMGTARDVRGDRRGRGSKTLPVLIGVRNSLLLSSLFYLFGVLLSVIPYLYVEPYKENVFYILPVFLADLILLYIVFGSLREPSREFMLLSRKLSLAAMGIALAGFLAGALIGG